LAKEVKENLNISEGERRYPIVVEFAGFPKAGKTTAAEHVSLLLSRNGIGVKQIPEQAANCPILDKTDPLFNIWTASTTLANLLDNSQAARYPIVMLDRGIYDSLIWLTLMRDLGKLRVDELDAVSRFVALPLWRNRVNLVIEMTTTVESALGRKYDDAVTHKQGPIMRETILRRLKEAASEVRKGYAAQFGRLVTVDTTGKSVREEVAMIAERVLDALRELTEELLVVVPRRIPEELALDGFCPAEHVFRAIEESVVHPITLRRCQVEDSENWVQLVACAVIRYGDSLLVSTKREYHPRKRFNGRDVIWTGGHVHTADAGSRDGGRFNLRLALLQCLRRELDQELRLRELTEPRLLGVCYDRTSEASKRHLAVVFEFTLENEAVKDGLDKRHIDETWWLGVDTKFVSTGGDQWGEVKRLEPWSVGILRSVYGVNPIGEIA
jgi:predicted NUDIX family phosphoesterase